MRLANPIEIEGIFWFEEADYDERKRLSGYLTVDTDGRAQLRLRDVNALFAHDTTKRSFQMLDGIVRPYDWITGLGTGGELIWVHKAVIVGNQIFGGSAISIKGLALGGDSQVYSFSAPYVFIGNRPNSDAGTRERPNALEFKSLACEIEGVWEWLGISGFKYSKDIAQWYLGDCQEILDIQYERPSENSLQSEEPLEWHEGRPKANLAFRVTPSYCRAPFTGQIYPEFTLKETTTIEIKPAEGAFNLSDVTQHMKMLRNFFAIVMDAPVDIVQCEVSTAETWRQGGKSITTLSLYCNTGKLEGDAYAPGRVKTALLGRPLTECKNRDIWTKLIAWYEQYAEHEYAIGEYLAGRFSVAPLSSRVMALWRALDSLTKSTGIKHSLRCLLKPILGNKKEREFWIEKLADTRNKLAHGRRTEDWRPPSRDDLEIAYAMFVFAINLYVLESIGWTRDVLLGGDNRAGWLFFLETEWRLGDLHRFYLGDKCKKLSETDPGPVTLREIECRLGLGDKNDELKTALEWSGWKRKGNLWHAPDKQEP